MARERGILFECSSTNVTVNSVRQLHREANLILRASTGIDWKGVRIVRLISFSQN
jgi:hypothetical protein